MEKELIRLYFNNTATPEEQQAVTRWLIDNASKEEVLAMIESAWNESDNAASAPPPPFDKILAQAMRREKQDAKVVSIRKRKFWGMTAAASIAFLVVGMGIGFVVASGRNDTALSAIRKDGRTTITLGDGTEVILNKASRLMLDEGSTIHQTVYLEGEASFNVSNAAKSLIIKTKDIVTTTKGSKLKISASLTDSVVKVSVDKGKAEVKPNEEKFYPLLKLYIPKKKDSTAIAAAPAEEEKPKIMPLIKLRPVVVKANELMTFNRNNGATNIGLATQDSVSVYPGQ